MRQFVCNILNDSLTFLILFLLEVSVETVGKRKSYEDNAQRFFSVQHRTMW